jgi:phage repressor protein C with HTH and peptisase S24 domain
MIEVHICDWDIAISHTGLTEGNGVFVVSVGVFLVVKRVDKDPSNHIIILISANQDCEPCRFSDPELDGIMIAGKIMAVYLRV